MKNKNISQIIFSIIFIILFGIMFLIQLNDLVFMLNNSGSAYDIILTILAIIMSCAGIYVSLVYGIVKVMNTTKKGSGGKRNDKEKKK